MAVRWLLGVLAGANAWSVAGAQDAPPSIPKPEIGTGPSYPVVRVEDGRYVRVSIDGAERCVELCGVNVTPAQPASDDLHRFLERLLAGENVLVHFAETAGGAPDVPRRAWLFRTPDGLFVNLEVVRQGYAKTNAGSAGEHLDLLRYYERRAREAHKGVWAPAPGVDRTPNATPRDSAARNPGSKADQTTVYVTKTGRKYHRKGCQHLRKSSRPISLKEAIAKGYGPCKRCKPPTASDP